MNNLPESDKSKNDQKTNPIKPLERPPLPKKSTNRKIKTRCHEQQCDQIKQNILTSRFLRKKQKLFEITRQNVRLFQKINSQKSIYSHESFQKSYQSNLSLSNSRLSNKSKNMRFKMSQISGRSEKSSKSIENKENTFINRAKSVSIITRPKVKRIIVRNPQRLPLMTLQQKNVQNIKTQDSNQLSRLFNIKQQPSAKQRNRPIRIRSTKSIRARKPQYQKVNEKISRYSSNQQIVINEENKIEIHEQIEIEKFQPFQKKICMVRESKDAVLMMKNNKKMEALQQDKLANIIPAMHTQQSHKSQLRLSNSQRSLQRSKTHNENNYQSQLAMKNSLLNQRLQNKIGEGVTTKYKNLMEKINAELNKHKIKSIKQTTIYPYKSRLIA